MIYDVDVSVSAKFTLNQRPDLLDVCLYLENMNMLHYKEGIL